MSATPTVTLHLDGPPRIANVGVGVHGTARLTDAFRLRDLWQLHLYRYTADLYVDGVAHVIRPGYVSLAPPGALVRYRYRGRSEHLYAHLEIPETGAPRIVPVVQDAGAETPVLSDLLQQAVSSWTSAPERSAAEVWTALWRVAALSATAQPHTAVAAALAHIESGLAGPLTASGVAAAVGVSHNHLARLFRAHTGSTVIAHIRRRRLDRARHLLRESTLPIATIAAAVGIPDLQAFNKACRRELGASPRTIRSG
ncbi:MAG TPA: helix-turn-helix transcriptional regulator [Trebonia sp.]|jgi:AraC family transcriptional regulator|nr:helix-turn-helix transcriptional regulator [Trebonia sp.]